MVDGAPLGRRMRITPADFPSFQEAWPWRGPHLQTIRNRVRPPRIVLPPAERLRVETRDGTGDTLIGALNRPFEDKGRPLILLVHGLTGYEDGVYMRATARTLLAAGYPVLRLNQRGAGPSRGLCRERYHAGRTHDLRRVLEELPPDLSGRGVVPVGYSLGGNVVLKLLGEGGAPVPLSAGASISAPIDLAAASRRFQVPGNRFYHRYLLTRMKEEMLGGSLPLEGRWARAVRQARSVWEFDDAYVGPANGWSGAEEYYRVNSALRFLPRIDVPTLVIHAMDDPWIPADAYLSFDWTSNAHLLPLLSPRGGHVGFHGQGGVWHDRCLEIFLERLFGHRS